MQTDIKIEGKAISITIFREGDRADSSYGDGLSQLGLAKAQLLVEFDYHPAQRLILQAPNKEDMNYE